jgi:hypothetical protein
VRLTFNLNSCICFLFESHSASPQWDRGPGGVEYG